MLQAGKVYGYFLLDQYGETKYIGITNDPGKRKVEHRRDGKEFESMEIKLGPVPRSEAKQWEATQLKNFRTANNGRNPTYNLTEDGTFNSPAPPKDTRFRSKPFGRRRRRSL